MNVLIKTATALGFILVIPLFALPAHGAPAYEAGISRSIIASRIPLKQGRS
jgi:hypothetical protein